MSRLLGNAVWLGIGLGVVVLLVWAFLPTAAEVDVATVGRGGLTVSVDREGKTRVRQRYVVSAPLAGRMQRIDLRPGDAVTAGKTSLVVIEPTNPALLDARERALAEARVDAAGAKVRQAAAALDRSRALHEQAEAELERQRRLWAGRAASEQDYQVTQALARALAAEVRVGEFARRTAEFELEQARAAFVYTRPEPSPGAGGREQFGILAPVSGVVLRVFQESATVVSPGTRLLEVGDAIDLECEVDVLSTDAVRIEPGQRVIVEHWGGPHALEGRVRRREPSAFTKVSALGVEEQRVNIIIDLLDPVQRRRTLGDGYRIEARVVIWEGKDVLKVPSGALFRREGVWAVFRVVNGAAVLTEVAVGHDNGLEAEVLGGLKEGDRVVLHPSDRVRPGAAVTARPLDVRR